ncbi:response regulator [Ramlibacter sp.]|uniref:response regulator n=1 Tax=Ramlibacter sp. TaxID=1917967 RepID=UPI003D0DEFFE
MTEIAEQPRSSHDIFVGDSAMAQLMRSHDWSQTPLGPAEQWPQTLRVALRILLTSRFDMWLGWGKDVHFFYNDAYRPTLGMKHPRSLAMPTRELWPEIWDDIKDRIATVYERGESTWDEALLLILERAGYSEETYHTFSYSPLIGDTGAVEGLFCAVVEETDRVLGERRLGALRELARGLAKAYSFSAVLAATVEGLRLAMRDLPFSVLYLFDDEGEARLAASAGIDAGVPLAPAPAQRGGNWDAERVRAGDGTFVVPLATLEGVPCGPWDKPAARAIVVPLARQGAGGPAGFLACAVNPYRPTDQDFIGFVQLLAGQIAASLSNAEDYEARIAERDRLRNMFLQAPSFIAILRGPQHVFELANDSYLRLVGHREVEGKSVREALPEIRGQGFFELLDMVYASRETYVGSGVPVTLHTEPGAPPTERFLDFVYQPILDSTGRTSGIFVEGHDVTEKFRAEQELKHLNTELEARVAQRTNDLAKALERLRSESREREAIEEALRHAQKMEAVGQLTGGIAHDFNNLLQGITGSLDLLKLRLQLGKLDNIDRLITGALSSAHKAAGLTHRLLAFSRRQPLDPKPVKANQLIAPMEELLRRTVGENIRIELVLSGGLWTTLCDPVQLESALLNLCINARDAMPDGGTLTIETANAWLDAAYAAKEDLVPGQYVCISVTDSGQGIPADVLSRVFEPFFTTKPIGQGTGLGLSMVYGFAKQSSGHVKLYSEAGHGTTAKLYLPRHHAEPVQLEPNATLRAEDHEGRSEIVLVVEDEPVVRTLVVDVLESLGFRVIEAVDGPSALRILQSEQRIDLLVSDVGLPGMNGRQVYDAAASRRPGLKVLFMTGYAENAALSKGFLDPGMELITKPFAMEQLASRIRAML